MTRILWVSRHTMTERQRDSLDRIFGNVEIIQYDKTIEDVEDLVKEYEADVYAVVFPTELLARLYRAVGGKARIITPVAERRETGNYIVNPATGKKEKEYAFELKHWLEYTRIDIETKILE